MNPADPLTDDKLTRDWRIWQRRDGHRHSTDDLLTAWYACGQTSRRARLLDLGSGIGGVGLLVLWRSPGATLTAVEAQEVSHALLLRNVERNGLAARVRVLHGDLRELALPGETFDLVTGSPPYFPPGTGVMPADSQKAHARFELRGDVRDYCTAAVRFLAPDGVFTFCFPSAQRERALQAARDAGLHVTGWRDVVPREGRAPLFTLFHCVRAVEGVSPTVEEAPHVVRRADGTPTAEHAAARATFGL